MKETIAVATISVMLLASSIPLSNVGSLAFAESEIFIRGSGASFAFPLIDLWRVMYQDVNPDVKLDYQSIGSGGGVSAHIKMLNQFGATEAPLSDAEAAAAPGTVTIPAMVGAVALVYNIDGVASGMDLTEEALCGIFLGDITQWNDPAIADHNLRANLPDDDIVVVSRSDAAGTTYAFTSYLTKTCPAWDERIGAAKSVSWPTGTSSLGNEGVAATVLSTENSIGYVTLAYARVNDITTADIQNGDHTAFVRPTVETAGAAAGGFATYQLPAATDSWKDVDLLKAKGFNSYPITSFSYIIIHPDLGGRVTDSKETAQGLIDALAWMITEGQRYGSELGYAPIADLVTNIGLEGLEKVTYNGESLSLETTDVWASDTRSDNIDSSIDDLYEMYTAGDIDQSTFLNLMASMLQLYDLFEEGLITESEVDDAITKILP